MKIKEQHWKKLKVIQASMLTLAKLAELEQKLDKVLQLLRKFFQLIDYILSYETTIWKVSKD